jgi:DNA invertase Pin-like site-specific DNA recombinase
MNELLVGYARVSTEQQDLTTQRNGLHALGVGEDRVYVDHGLTGANRDRPGLRLALAACHSGDTLVVTKLDRLARSLPHVRDILHELTKRNVKLSLGGSIHDPTDPVGRLPFNVLAMVAEFESDLIRLRSREGMKVAKAKGRLRGKQPKLKPKQAKHLLELHDSGSYTQGLAELFGVGAIYRPAERVVPDAPAERVDRAARVT